MTNNKAYNDKDGNEFIQICVWDWLGIFKIKTIF